MKRISITLSCALCFLIAQAQWRLAPDTMLERQIIASGLIHSPLPLDVARSYEANAQKKPVRYAQPFSGKQRLAFPTITTQRAQGSPDDPDYATYGSAQLRIAANGADWTSYNRIAFSVYPDCEGARVVNLDFHFSNEPSHLLQLTNGEWNRCLLDIGNLPRNHVNEIGFSCSIKGRDRTTGDSAVFLIDHIELQQVSAPDAVSGWLPDSGRIVYSTTGYVATGSKTAILTAPLRSKFQLTDAKGKRVYEGALQRRTTTIGNFDIADFSDFNTPGAYRLQVGTLTTEPFVIGEDIWQNSLWRVLNFIFCQRCGYPVPGKHGACHADLFSQHNEKSISYAGGWHDAGDLSQQTLQTGDVTFALLEAYNRLKKTNTPLAMRLLEEAEWGVEFILHNRYGDGYRASSMGLLIWTDGIQGTRDDITSVRVQNLAFDNFLYAAYEAYAAMSIDHDPMLQAYLKKTAKEDFAFALQRHQTVGYGEFLNPYEHTYPTPQSQYMATVSWAASMLYQLTGEACYADIAAEYIRYVMDCQHITPLLGNGANLAGFFYRDTTQRSIVHYNHQSREQVFAQALIGLCRTQPDHPDRDRWEASVKLYGNYLKELKAYTLPYGMLPSGVYHIDEPRDTVAFEHLHLFAPANAVTLYEEQLRQGAPLGNGYYVKRFPVWFGIFNGNTAVHLAMGKAAAACGNFLGDNELKQIGLEQMYWVTGKNPFGQSLIYGEGNNYPQMDSFSSGEMTGEIPVGIRTPGNEDTPYFPHINNACYKEVWTTAAGKWLSIAAEYE